MSQTFLYTEPPIERRIQRYVCIKNWAGWDMFDTYFQIKAGTVKNALSDTLFSYVILKTNNDYGLEVNKTDFHKHFKLADEAFNDELDELLK